MSFRRSRLRPPPSPGSDVEFVSHDSPTLDSTPISNGNNIRVNLVFSGGKRSQSAGQRTVNLSSKSEQEPHNHTERKKDAENHLRQFRLETHQESHHQHCKPTTDVNTDTKTTHTKTITTTKNSNNNNKNSSNNNNNDNLRSHESERDFSLPPPAHTSSSATEGRNQFRLNPIRVHEEMKLPPWVDKQYVGQDLTLHDEIIRFCQYTEPSIEEQQRRGDLIARLQTVVTSTWQRAKLVVFGSYRTDLFLPVSDLDLVVFGAPGSGKTSMFKLAQKLRSMKSVKSLKVISRARVPIIKFTDRETNTDIDISFDQESGLDSSSFIKDAMKAWPELKPLVLILKYFLLLREHNEPFTGGIGSYALVIMVLSHLQMFRYHSSPPDLGSLLIEFLDLYGKRFNYVITGLSVRGQGSYFRKEKRGWDSDEVRLSAEDPQDPDNDAGKCTFNMLKIKEEFRIGINLLKQDHKHKHLRRGQLRKQTFLQRFFGVNFNMIERHRLKQSLQATDQQPQQQAPDDAQAPDDSQDQSQPSSSDNEFGDRYRPPRHHHHHHDDYDPDEDDDFEAYMRANHSPAKHSSDDDNDDNDDDDSASPVRHSHRKRNSPHSNFKSRNRHSHHKKKRLS